MRRKRGIDGEREMDEETEKGAVMGPPRLLGGSWMEGRKEGRKANAWDWNTGNSLGGKQSTMTMAASL